MGGTTVRAFDIVPLTKSAPIPVLVILPTQFAVNALTHVSHVGTLFLFADARRWNGIRMAKTAQNMARVLVHHVLEPATLNQRRHTLGRLRYGHGRLRAGNRIRIHRTG